MNLDKTYGFFESSNGTDRIAYYIYTPKTEVRAAVQISHDMCKYTELYEHFINFLCQHGFAVFCHDHLGHGHSVNSTDNYGYFAAENGWHYLVKDMRKMTNIIKEHYPLLPVFLFGHNLGTLIVRAYMAKYFDKINGIILFGTAGRSDTADIGILTSTLLCKAKGGKYRTACLEKLLFGKNDVNYCSGFDRICRCNKDIENYILDDGCGFIFTARGFLDLFYLQAYASQKAWAGKIPSDIPILIMSSECEPESRYSTEPHNIFRRLCDAGIKNLEINIYKKDEYEAKQNKTKIYKDILNWINKQL